MHHQITGYKTQYMREEDARAKGEKRWTARVLGALVPTTLFIVLKFFGVA